MMAFDAVAATTNALPRPPATADSKRSEGVSGRSVSVGPVTGDSSRVTSIVQKSEFANGRSNEIFRKLLYIARTQHASENVFLQQVQEKFIELIETQMAKGDATEADNSNILRAKDLAKIAQEIFQEIALKQAEMDKMEQINGIEIAKKKTELWVWAEQQQIEILNAEEQLATRMHKRKLEREDHNFRHQIELLKLQSHNAHQDSEYLLNLQRLKAEGKESSLPLPKTTTLLHEAVKLGDPAFIRKFLEAKFPKDNLDPDGNTPLACAVAAGKVEVAKLFNPTKKDTTVKNKKKQTLLHLAVHSGNPEMVAFVYALNKQDVDPRDEKSRTPLFCAVEANHMEIAKYLKEQGARMDVRDNEGNTLVDCAFQHEKRGMVEWLMESDPELLKNEGKDGYQPVARAICKGDLSLAKKMLAKGAEFDVDNPTNRTLIHWMAKKGFCDCIDWLIELGFPINQLDSNGHSPILSAILKGQIQAIRCLKKHRAQVVAPHLGSIVLSDGIRFSPTLAQAAVYSKHPIEVLSEVVKKPEHLLTTHDSKFIPLQMAVTRGLVAVAKYINHHPFHRDQDTKRSNTLLSLAVQSGTLEMLEWVHATFPFDMEAVAEAMKIAISLDNLKMARWLHEKRGIQPNSSFLIEWACSGVQEEVLDWILSFPNTNLNFENTTHQTAIIYACHHHNIIALKCLLARGALVSGSDINGNTIWHHIASNPASTEAMIKELNAKKTPSINDKAKDGVTAIQIALEVGNVRLAEAFETQLKANTQVWDNQDQTLLHSAAQSGRVEGMQYANAKCCKWLNAKDKNGKTALEISIERGHFACAVYLLDQGAELPKRLELLADFLAYAISVQDKIVLKKLLDQSVVKNTNFLINGRNTLPQVAILNGHHLLAEELLIYYPLFIESSLTVLDFIYDIIDTAKDPLEALKFLFAWLKSVPIVLESEKSQKNALLEAVAKRKQTVADFLMTKNTPADLKRQLFEAAVKSGSLEMAKWAYQRSDKPSLNLGSCIQYNQIEILRWGLQNNIPFPPEPLQIWAQFKGSEDMLNLLKKQGHPVEGPEGTKALSIALKYHHRIHAELLIERGAQLNFSPDEKRGILQATLFNPTFNTEFFEWFLCLADWPLRSIGKEGFNLLEEAIFMGAPLAAYHLHKEGLRAHLTYFHKGIAAQFRQRFATFDYPSRTLPKEISVNSEEGAIYYANDYFELNVALSKINSSGHDLKLPFLANEPSYRMVLPIAIIHGLRHVLKGLSHCLESAPDHALNDPNTSDEPLIVYCALYGQKNLFFQMLKATPKLDLRVPLSNVFTLKGMCLLHLAVIAESRAIEAKKELGLKEIDKKSFVDTTAAIFENNELIDEVTELGFIVLNPLKLPHALTIAKQLVALGAKKEAKSKNGKTLEQLAQLSQDAAMLEWVTSLFPKPQALGAK